MKLVIHAEVTDAEVVRAYEGDSPEAALVFLDELGELQILQCHLTAGGGEEDLRVLARIAKGEDVEPLKADIRSWIEENA